MFNTIVTLDTTWQFTVQSILVLDMRRITNTERHISCEAETMKDTCALCERENCAVTGHHLIPRMRHNKKVKRETTSEERNHKVPFCRPCHDQMHALFTEKELERDYNTVEKLKAQPEVQAWIAWVKTKSFGKC